MKRARAITHLAEMAAECAGVRDLQDQFDAPALCSLWAWGEVLDRWPDDQQFARAAAVFEAPAERIPWYARPPDLVSVLDLIGWEKRPVHVMYRSSELPVWNHEIIRPLRLWDREAGVDELAIAALRQGDVESRRPAAPPADLLRQQLDRERAASYAAMVATTEAYDANRWGKGNLRWVAEPMWEAAAGYVDLTEALGRL